MKIGILALQGAFAEHAQILERLKVSWYLIRKPEDLQPETAGLILPGGESTVIGKLLAETGLLQKIKAPIEHGMPVFGTCAGMILLAKRIEGQDGRYLDVLDATVRRNAYGRQLGSFTTNSDFAGIGAVPMVFIRAPYITEIGRQTEILASVEDHIVAVRQGNILATSFHPELTNDTKVHQYFLGMV
jgi:pyridoxal 5''-phosphate synthase, glutaminase subunit Pdx2